MTRAHSLFAIACAALAGCSSEAPASPFGLNGSGVGAAAPSASASASASASPIGATDAAPVTVIPPGGEPDAGADATAPIIPLDAAPSDAGSSICITLDPSAAPFADETTVQGSSPPPMTGGTIEPGVYHMTKGTAYFPGSAAAQRIPMRSVVNVAPGTYFVHTLGYANGTGAPATHEAVFGGLMTTNGGNLASVSYICGQGVPGQIYQLQYAASPGKFMLASVLPYNGVQVDEYTKQ